MDEKKNLTTKETFDLAVQEHQKNNLQVAANLYKEILKTNPNHAGKGFIEVFRSIYAREGLNGLYRGWGITAARAAPAHAAIFAGYEYTMKLLGPSQNSNASFTMHESVRD